MQERTLKELKLTNEDYVFDGNLTIEEEVEVFHGSIKVSGKLVLKGFKEENWNCKCVIYDGNIIADSLKSRIKINVYFGNIIIKSDAFFAHVSVVRGNIIVDGSCKAFNVDCCNYLISGDNTSDDVTATEDIYILKKNYSGDLKAREIFLGASSLFAPYGPVTVTAKYFEHAAIRNHRRIQIG